MLFPKQRSSVSVCHRAINPARVNYLFSRAVMYQFCSAALCRHLVLPNSFTRRNLGTLFFAQKRFVDPGRETSNECIFRRMWFDNSKEKGRNVQI